jgi:hypothetical protein
MAHRTSSVLTEQSGNIRLEVLLRCNDKDKKSISRSICQQEKERRKDKNGGREYTANSIEIKNVKPTA